ncbi:hypothetical protein DFW101_1326 [Solidesulfovibrio carbinoliphilus subsp. oakridgensis]|uniref:Lipoprotein n=1 Tax=Solidesulfovibrio carbinoliphilus subsp. oakridgensis TaxID=694327 RepID=G7Q7M6_9BACT|nr:hypothetical protein [Solidesulfovibrio carbinoliphilus]EHJ47335.1 hypothetical protein DFW101_1326 [Solidesulfovibrio carbinoliphilus subsp. oakridgensis]
MFRSPSCWLPVAALCCLLATVPAQGAGGGETRDVSIPGTGLTLRVAPDIAVFPGKPAHPGDATLSVTVEALQAFPRNGVVTRAEVLAQRAALAAGQAQVADGGGGEAGLAEVVPLPTGGSAVIYPEYSEFEVCDLRFAMVAVFFTADRRITLRLSLPPAAIVRENPVFFGHDKANCGAAAVWKHPGPDLFKRFHEAAKAGRLGPSANAWYADFTAILASLRQKIPAG